MADPIYSQVPLSTPITFCSGDDVSVPLQLVVQNPDGSQVPFDLSSNTLSAIMLTTCTQTSLTIDIVDFANAVVLVQFPSSLTSTMAQGGQYVWVLKNTVNSTGYTDQIARGWIQVLYGQINTVSGC